MKMIKYLLLILAITSVLFSCSKDEEAPKPKEEHKAYDESYYREIEPIVYGQIEKGIKDIRTLVEYKRMENIYIKEYQKEIKSKYVLNSYPLFLLYEIKCETEMYKRTKLKAAYIPANLYITYGDIFHLHSQITPLTYSILGLDYDGIKKIKPVDTKSRLALGICYKNLFHDLNAQKEAKKYLDKEEIQKTVYVLRNKLIKLWIKDWMKK